MLTNQRSAWSDDWKIFHKTLCSEVYKQVSIHVQYQTYKLNFTKSQIYKPNFTQPQLKNLNNSCAIQFFIMNTYTPSLALRNAIKRINNPPIVIKGNNNEVVYTKFEHHTATWACTKLKEIFRNDKWAITPEQRDPLSGKKPDLVVEEAIQGSTFKLHLAMELKKEGERIEDALAQLCDATLESIDMKGNINNGEFEIYAVVQAGLDIGFFEYHSDKSNLDEEGIPNFRGCVSLTQDYAIKGTMTTVLHNKPNDLKNLFHDFQNLKIDTDTRKFAKDYDIPCIFNIEKHQREVHFLFQYMENKPARSSW
jgi:hypothetical protein